MLGSSVIFLTSLFYLSIGELTLEDGAGGVGGAFIGVEPPATEAKLGATPGGAAGVAADGGLGALKWERGSRRSEEQMLGC